MANNFPNLRPTLNLDMVNGVYVDPRVTFTRAGTRTFFGREMVKAEENLLLNSATLSTQNVTVTATAYTVSFTGTGTITLSGASTAGPLVGTGVSDRVSLTFTPTAGTLTLTVTGSVTLAQLENRSSLTAYTATTTQPITRYQRLLKTAAANEWPREFDPVTGECLGRSVWESRTNLLLRSEEFDNAYWEKTNVSASANQTIAPNGTLTADLITENTASGFHVVQRAFTTSAVNYSLTIFAKAGTRNWLQVRVFDGTTLYAAFFNLSTGAIGTVAGSAVATITSIGNGWYRCSVTPPSAVLASASGYMQYAFGSADNTPNYTGNGTGNMFIWGAQLEAGAFATPYIPTVASQITRLADSAVMTGVNFSSWFNPEQGCLFVDSSTPSGATRNRAAIISDGTSSNVIINEINTSSNISGFVAVSGSTQAGFGGTPTAGINYKQALSYKFNDFAFCRDGGAVSSDTTGTVPVVNQLGIGVLGAGTPGNGYIKRLTYYPQALTSANLQAITR